MNHNRDFLMNQVRFQKQLTLGPKRLLEKLVVDVFQVEGDLNLVHVQAGCHAQNLHVARCHSSKHLSKTFRLSANRPGVLVLLSSSISATISNALSQPKKLLRAILSYPMVSPLKKSFPLPHLAKASSNCMRTFINCSIAAVVLIHQLFESTLEQSS
ncbi:hypothetical protein RHGRI_033611 [Rhododendron griersonianum]|uniref:Uncharacterized protein n=1 Tax=Rhododendron griersonianum TaxID=479676 RepID=A0AAV6I0I8_9ERIC|nr:hypothetical protein RHGRI_033611 [Rhododendron griersonianum]